MSKSDLLDADGPNVSVFPSVALLTDLHRKWDPFCCPRVHFGGRDYFSCGKESRDRIQQYREM